MRQFIILILTISHYQITGIQMKKKRKYTGTHFKNGTISVLLDVCLEK